MHVGEIPMFPILLPVGLWDKVFITRWVLLLVINMFYGTQQGVRTNTTTNIWV